jgi:hypothetical protein
MAWRLVVTIVPAIPIVALGLLTAALIDGSWGPLPGVAVGAIIGGWLVSRLGHLRPPEDDRGAPRPRPVERRRP